MERKQELDSRVINIHCTVVVLDFLSFQQYTYSYLGSEPLAFSLGLSFLSLFFPSSLKFISFQSLTIHSTSTFTQFSHFTLRLKLGFYSPFCTLQSPTPSTLISTHANSLFIKHFPFTLFLLILQSQASPTALHISPTTETRERSPMSHSTKINDDDDIRTLISPSDSN